jgi:hypothetical protein
MKITVYINKKQFHIDTNDTNEHLKSKLAGEIRHILQISSAPERLTALRSLFDDSYGTNESRLYKKIKQLLLVFPSNPHTLQDINELLGFLEKQCHWDETYNLPKEVS